MKLLTANRLSDGEAVWLGSGERWVESIDQAELARDKEAQERLEQIGREAQARDEVVDVNLIDVDLVDGKARPIRLRERIRAAGPTIHHQLGKQARKTAIAPV
ncbi:DUF2849 domain-containing protein [Chelativorans sp. YIM 93263]|uniref:DUF2849 domain-containing protein n=1 Tax=Chelativorans sp. YIM 93263 TaxID=2906648 RepID=UPI002379292E|nr:DUF2849 domain-containing protein [Chelativorans sp. YIM 93263]